MTCPNCGREHDTTACPFPNFSCYPYYHSTQMGWQCPICHKVNAPWMPSCDCHRKEVVNEPT